MITKTLPTVRTAKDLARKEIKIKLDKGDKTPNKTIDKVITSLKNKPIIQAKIIKALDKLVAKEVKVIEKKVEKSKPLVQPKHVTETDGFKLVNKGKGLVAVVDKKKVEVKTPGIKINTIPTSDLLAKMQESIANSSR